MITDGNNELGLGHVYQSLTLAQALKEKLGPSLHLLFMTKSNFMVCDFIRSFDYDVEYFGDDELIFERLRKYMPDRVIFDKLDVSPILASQIKEELQLKLVIFTNLTKANDYADIVVFPGFGVNTSNVISRDADSGRIGFYGLKFWILRPEFYSLNNKHYTDKAAVENIMLIFGGSDPSNLSTHVLDTLLQIDFAFNILLVLGSAFEHGNKLQYVLKERNSSKSNVNIVKNITNVGKRMQENDVVFASPGLSFSEALVAGTPVLGFHQNELQRAEYARAFPTIGLADLHQLPSIIQNKQFIFPNDPMIQSMEIGQGRELVIDEIIN